MASADCRTLALNRGCHPQRRTLLQKRAPGVSTDEKKAQPQAAKWEQKFAAARKPADLCHGIAVPTVPGRMP